MPASAPGVRVDLSSLGKGRGVDRVAEYLDARGVTNYLIDLSGKLRARGLNARGEPWRVAVERPTADATSDARRLSSPPSLRCIDESVATAGDYRRFFEIDGRHYSHIIDPRTGLPVTHGTVSASAIAADCMQADALATVLMVMSPDEALALANRRATARTAHQPRRRRICGAAQRQPGRRTDAVGRRCRASRICADRAGSLLGR